MNNNISIEKCLDYYIDALKKYDDFEGRATREQYWCFILINLGVAVLLDVISLFSLGIPLLYVCSIVLSIPAIAITTRRLHDLGKSGWLQLAVFIPVVGILWLLWLLTQPGITQKTTAKENN